MRVPWLAQVLRDAGLPVYEDPGWKGRGRELTTVNGVVWHHTATGTRWADGHVLALLRHGRSDLAGPLSQLGLERDGTWVCIADGRANHNGYGKWGNQSIGVEAYNDGIGERWPSVQVDSYHLGTAAICRHLGMGADRVLGHRETDPRRKIDPTGIDMVDARRRVHLLLSGSPKPPPKEMFTVSQFDDLMREIKRAKDEANAARAAATIAASEAAAARQYARQAYAYGKAAAQWSPKAAEIAESAGRIDREQRDAEKAAQGKS